MTVFLIKNDVLAVEALFDYLWLFRTIVAQGQHSDWESPIRQIKQLSMELIMLHGVTDVAGTNAQRFRSNHGILRSTHGIFNSKQQIGFLRCFEEQAVLIAVFADTILFVIVEPALMVGKEEQQNRSRCNECLIIAGFAQDFFGCLVLDDDDGIEHLIACGRRTHCSLQNGIQILLGNITFIVTAQRYTAVDGFQSFVHSQIPLAPILPQKQNGIVHKILRSRLCVLTGCIPFVWKQAIHSPTDRYKQHA